MVIVVREFTMAFARALAQRCHIEERRSRRLQGAEAHLVMRVVQMPERWAVATSRETSCLHRQWVRLLLKQQGQAPIG